MSRQMRGGSSTGEPQPSARASRAAPGLENQKIIPQQFLFQPDKRWEPEIGKDRANKQQMSSTGCGQNAALERAGLGDWEREERAKDAGADYRATLQS